MLNRLNKLKERQQKTRETFDYKLGYSVLELTENILKRMEAININRTELARRLNISKSAVTRMLDGNTNFTHKRLLSIALALDCETIGISFPPQGFKTPSFFVAHAPAKLTPSDYRVEPFQGISELTGDNETQVA